jgi:hypothetical protein
MFYYKTVIDNTTYYFNENAFCAYNSTLQRYILCSVQYAQDVVVNDKIYRVDWLFPETGPDAGTHQTIQIQQTTKEEYDAWRETLQEQKLKEMREISES